MDLDQLLDTVAQSDPSDWSQVISGPTYRGMYWMTQTHHDTSLEYYEHPYTAVYRTNIDITIAWGLDPNEAADRNDLDFGFPSVFPDASASVDLVDIFYRGALVHREELLSVDGNRALLPICEQRYSGEVDEDGKKLLEYRTSTRSKNIARVVHGFTHGSHDFDEYFQRAGLLVTEDR